MPNLHFSINNHSFTLSDKEQQELDDFISLHRNCLKTYPDVSGSYLSYEFIPNGLGTWVTITCSCKENINFTDMS